MEVTKSLGVARGHPICYSSSSIKTSVNQLSDTKIAVTITVDEQALADAEQVALTKLARTVKAPGFRKGKVPMSVAAKYVDPSTLAQQTLDDALSKAVSQVFTEQKIQRTFLSPRGGGREKFFFFGADI